MISRSWLPWLVCGLALLPCRAALTQEKVDPAPTEQDSRDPFAGPRVPAESAAEKPADDKPATEKPADEESTNKESADTTKSAEKAETQPAKANEKSEEKTVEKAKDKSEDKADDAEAAATEIRLVALSGTYMDLVQPVGLDATSLLMSGPPTKQKSFFKLCEYIDELAKEEDLKHIVFDLSDADLALNAAQLDELARHMSKLADAKQKTIAWLENASNIHLAIAANCDQIVMADFGGVDIPSAAMESMFYRDAMDLLGIKASVVRAGEFKGAVEPYVNPVMSVHLRAHYMELLKSVNDARVSLIASGRGLKSEELRKLQAKRMLLPAEALAGGLVDRLAPYGSMKATIEEMVAGPTRWTTPKAKAKKEMSFFELMGMMMQGPSSTATRVRDDSIAVLHLSGAIVDGTRKSSGAIVSGPTVKMIQELANEEKIKGVVVRINSPGGSATASESIRQALAALAKKKPTVVSMGQMAASGGYWISCIDTPVYAERGTVTGSIGVFAMKISIGSLLRRVGVHVESITLDDSASLFAIDRAWSDEEIGTFQGTIDHVYKRFVDLVAEHRGMQPEQVTELGGGRVWSGTQAKANGLIDAIGGLDDCLAVVAKKAELDNYKVLHRPEASTGLNLAELLGQSDDDEILWNLMPKDAVSLLTRRGLPLDTTLTLLRDALTQANHQPTIWLLGPAEISIH